MEVVMSIAETNDRYSITDWNDRYAIGIPVIDSRYRDLFFLFNTNSDSFIEYAAANDLTNILHQLIEYARYQFFAEERWMQYHLFPRLTHHVKEHGDILTKVSDISKESSDGSWPLSLEILEVMHLWLKTHILWSDEEICDFIAAKKLNYSHLSCQYKKKTADTAKIVLHAWHNYYSQTVIKIAPPPELIKNITCNNEEIPYTNTIS